MGSARDEQRKRYTEGGCNFAGERRGKPISLADVAAASCAPPRVKTLEARHGFRRGLGTNLYSRGVPPKVMQEVLCHADARTTEAYYIVAERSETTKAMKKLEPTRGKEQA